jgi:hypothetical protein
MARALERADLAAQAQPIEIRKPERDDQNVVIAFRSTEQGGIRVGFELHGMLAGQHV